MNTGDVENLFHWYVENCSKLSKVEQFLYVPTVPFKEEKNEEHKRL